LSSMETTAEEYYPSFCLAQLLPEMHLGKDAE